MQHVVNMVLVSPLPYPASEISPLQAECKARVGKVGFLEEVAFYSLGLLLISGSVQEPGLL